MITGQSNSVLVLLSVYGGQFHWHHRLMKYIMSKHHWDNKTIKPNYFFKYICVIIYDQNHLYSLFWFNDFALESNQYPVICKKINRKFKLIKLLIKYINYNANIFKFHGQ